MEIPLTRAPREKWYCRQISRDGKKHSLSGGGEGDWTRFARWTRVHASAPAKPCLNIVLELTGPCRAATNRNEAQLERLGNWTICSLDSWIYASLYLDHFKYYYIFFLIDFLYRLNCIYICIFVLIFYWQNKTICF